MTVVVDASVALKWVLREDDSPLAHALLDRQRMIAPDFWRVEVANGLWKAVGRREMSVPEALAGLELFEIAPVEAVATADLLEAAFSYAARLKHPVYECLYLALAIQRQTVVVTADNRFFRALHQEPELQKNLVLLADFSG